MDSEIVDIFTAHYQNTVAGVQAGIQRFLDRDENIDLWAAMAGNPLWAVFQQSIDDDIFERMDAEVWINSSCNCSFDWYDVWSEAFYQVAAVLCLDDGSDDCG